MRPTEWLVDWVKLNKTENGKGLQNNKNIRGLAVHVAVQDLFGSDRLYTPSNVKMDSVPVWLHRKDHTRVICIHL